MFVMAGYNIVNPRCVFMSIVYFYTLIKEGSRVRNIKAVRFLPLQVISEADIFLLL